MPKRQDEELLWSNFDGEGLFRTPRDAAQALGMNSKRVIYLCLKWTRQGIYNYGVSADLGWKEPRG